MFIDIAKEEYYTVKDKEFKVKPTNWWNDGLTFLINNQSVRLKPYQNITFEEATIFQENVTITGGYCKEDVED